MRRCPSCGPLRWKKYKQRQLFAGLEGRRLDDVLMITLTAPGGADESWNEMASHYWGGFTRRMRRAYPGVKLEYYRVGEMQERGLIHYHIVLVGLGFIPYSKLQRLAMESGFGPNCWISKVKQSKGGVKGVVGYVSKYLLKAVGGWDVEGQQVITHSQGWGEGVWRPRWKRPPGQESDWRYVGQGPSMPSIERDITLEDLQKLARDIDGEPPT